MFIFPPTHPLIHQSVYPSICVPTYISGETYVRKWFFNNTWKENIIFHRTPNIVKRVNYNIIIALLYNMGEKEIIADSDENLTGGLMCF